MAKKSKLNIGMIVLVVIIAGVGGFAAFHFYAINKRKQEQATMTQQQTAVLARRRYR